MRDTGVILAPAGRVRCETNALVDSATFRWDIHRHSSLVPSTTRDRIDMEAFQRAIAELDTPWRRLISDHCQLLRPAAVSSERSAGHSEMRRVRLDLRPFDGLQSSQMAFGNLPGLRYTTQRTAFDTLDEQGQRNFAPQRSSDQAWEHLGGRSCDGHVP